MTDYTVLARISVTLVGVSVALCSIRGEAMEDSEGGGRWGFEPLHHLSLQPLVRFAQNQWENILVPIMYSITSPIAENVNTICLI